MAKRGKSKAAKSKALHRDNWECGRHLGGCGSQIERASECSVDHIVPLGLAELIAPDPLEFDRPWNYQPMHVGCNGAKANRMNGRELAELEKVTIVGANTPDDWPRFQCKCHYLQIFGRDLYVCTHGPVGTGKHKLYAGVVLDFGKEDRQDGIMVSQRWTGPGGTNAGGFSRIGKNIRGFIFPSFSPKRVPGFNIFEAQRVGLPTPKYIYIDKKGYVTPVLRKGGGQPR